MKNTILFTMVLFGAFSLIAGSLLAAESAKEDVTSAAKALANKANYSWKTTVVVPEGSRFRPGPTEGKTAKNGPTHVTMSFGDNTWEAVLEGDKAAVTNNEGEWQSVTELENSEGPGRFLAMMVRNIKTPAVEAAELVNSARALTKQGQTYAGELTENGAKDLLRFRRGGDGPAVSNAKGSVKFWLKDGLPAKYEFTVKGTVSFNNNDFEVDRTTTVEIKDIGTTTVTVPEQAKKKLS